MSSDCFSLASDSWCSRSLACSCVSKCLSLTSYWLMKFLSCSRSFSFSSACLSRSPSCSSIFSCTSLMLCVNFSPSSFLLSSSDTALCLASSTTLLFCFCSSLHSASSFLRSALARDSSPTAASFSDCALSTARCCEARPLSSLLHSWIFSSSFVCSSLIFSAWLSPIPCSCSLSSLTAFLYIRANTFSSSLCFPSRFWMVWARVFLRSSPSG
mmetsp:Transcript_32311/g.81393  ORF Transcript_32311/g.81393 Transcript_32311/m.81393 type:complete len:213 (-) Transcript_32311:96-734(-)